MDQQMIMDIIRTILYVLITGAGVVVAKKLVAWLNTKVDQIQVNVKNKKINDYIDQAQDAISTAVVSTAQTYVDSLKSSGEFNEKAQKKAKREAMSTAKNLLSDDAKKAIAEVYGDLDEYLDKNIEKVVRETKLPSIDAQKEVTDGE